jgi:hypothetical protein
MSRCPNQEVSQDLLATCSDQAEKKRAQLNKLRTFRFAIRLSAIRHSPQRK